MAREVSRMINHESQDRNSSRVFSGAVKTAIDKMVSAFCPGLFKGVSSTLTTLGLQYYRLHSFLGRASVTPWHLMCDQPHHLTDGRMVAGSPLSPKAKTGE